MTLSNAKAIKITSETWREGNAERLRLRRFARYARGKQKLPWLPDNVETEYRDIANKSASNWIDLVIRSTAQGLYVDGYPSNPNVWENVWQANGMDARQHALHRAVLTLGYSYLIAFPTDGDTPGVWLRPESALSLHACYADPSDEWPTQAVREVVKGKLYELYTADGRYTIGGSGPAAKVTFVEHGVDHPPVVAMRSNLDLLGTPMGEVEQVIPIQDRIVDATFTLQMVAKYGAFPQRWIAGIDISKPLTNEDGEVLTDGNGNPLFPTIKAYIDHILTAVDPDTKFGQFAAADLGQYVAALEAHIKHLAAITQTPPHYLLGSLVNLSAEALAAAEAGLQRKIGEKRVVLGEGYEQAMRLAAAMLEDEDGAADMSSQVRWRDVESRSLAQVADALLKLNQLGVPVQVLLKMIPGFSQQDVEDAEKAIEEQGGIVAMVQKLVDGQTPKAA